MSLAFTERNFSTESIFPIAEVIHVDDIDDAIDRVRNYSPHICLTDCDGVVIGNQDLPVASYFTDVHIQVEAVRELVNMQRNGTNVVFVTNRNEEAEINLWASRKAMNALREELLNNNCGWPDIFGGLDRALSPGFNLKNNYDRYFELAKCVVEILRQRPQEEVYRLSMIADISVGSFGEDNFIKTLLYMLDRVSDGIYGSHNIEFLVVLISPKNKLLRKLAHRLIPNNSN